MKVKLLRDLNYRGDKYKAGDELTVTDIFYDTMKTRGVFIITEEAEVVEATEEVAEEVAEEAVEEKPARRRRGRKPKSGE